jgi:uncharacterized surface protein with fasciclin (FAS1) repeats
MNSSSGGPDESSHIVAAGLPGAGASAGSLVTSAPAAASSSQNIVQVASSSPQFSTLVSLVKKAGLVGALSGTTKLTVFAPTNAAFAAVPKATLDRLAANRSLLVKVLEYHVVKGEVLASQVLSRERA